MTKEKYEVISKRARKFSTQDAAKSYSKHTVKMSMIILGDDERFWVVTPAAASALVKAGFEYAD